MIHLQFIELLRKEMEIYVDSNYSTVETGNYQTIFHDQLIKHKISSKMLLCLIPALFFPPTFLMDERLKIMKYFHWNVCWMYDNIFAAAMMSSSFADTEYSLI